MPNRPRFASGVFYHVYNRGVEKRNIFLDEKDYFRFVHDLFEFNDKNPVVNVQYRHQKNYSSPTAVDSAIERQPRELLVDVVAFVLMPNHYHLLLRQRTENGVSLFMQKLGGGYTRYFNEKRERKGVLFQGKYKLKSINDHHYLQHLVQYIHLNPIELFIRRFPERKQSAELRIPSEKLRSYRWSSYRDYLGIKNFPSVVNFSLARDLGLVSGSDDHVLQGWVKRKRDEFVTYLFDET